MSVNSVNTEQANAVQSKPSIGSHILRFFITLIWVILATIFSIGGAMLMVSHDVESFFSGESILGYIGVAIPLIFAVITFCVPYLRKKGSTTRWCGVVLFGDAIYWIYLLITQS